MKKTLIINLLLFTSTLLFAQNEKYTQAMKTSYRSLQRGNKQGTQSGGTYRTSESL